MRPAGESAARAESAYRQVALPEYPLWAGTAVTSGRPGHQALMGFMEPAEGQRLTLQVLTVQPLDELLSWLLANTVRAVHAALIAIPGDRRHVDDHQISRLDDAI